MTGLTAPIHHLVERLLGLARSRKTRIALNAGSTVLVAVVTAFTVRHFVKHGWPLHHANVFLVLVAAAIFLVAYGFKAIGWSRLFVRDERPSPLELAAAGGAAAVTGIALPGRFDEAVRIGMVRRFRGKRTGVGALCLSLLLLGLIDSAALSPIAGIAAAVSGANGWILAGLIVVSVAGVAAAALVLALPRGPRTSGRARFRVARWVQEHCACPREAIRAWLFVTMSWLLRGVALFVLLHAVQMDNGQTMVLAIAFLCASAASAALPIAPAGAATQAGAGAAILIASGVHSSDALAFSVAAQALAILAGGAIAVAAIAWHARARFVPVRF
jgi:uncharacterized membrane protein YbhN (UPF0104 family)